MQTFFMILQHQHPHSEHSLSTEYDPPLIWSPCPQGWWNRLCSKNRSYANDNHQMKETFSHQFLAMFECLKYESNESKLPEICFVHAKHCLPKSCPTHFFTIWLISSGSEIDISQGLLAMSAYKAMHVPWFFFDRWVLQKSQPSEMNLEYMLIWLGLLTLQQLTHLAEWESS